MAQILQAVLEDDGDIKHCGATKTKIMFKTFLSYGQLKEYLTLLLENGPLDYDGGTKIYKITRKGKGF